MEKKVTQRVIVDRSGIIWLPGWEMYLIGADMEDMARVGMLKPYQRKEGRHVGPYGVVPGKYDVTYRLDPKGKLLATNELVTTIRWGRGGRDYISACFLPAEWHRRKVSRTVRRVK